MTLDYIGRRIRKPVPSRADCEDAVLMLRPGAEAKGLRLRAEIPDYLPVRIAGNGAALRQVLLDLMARSVDAAQAGEIRFQVGIEPANADSLLFHCEIESPGPAPKMPVDFSGRPGSASGSESRPGKASRAWFTAMLGSVSTLTLAKRGEGDEGHVAESPSEATRIIRALRCLSPRE